MQYLSEIISFIAGAIAGGIAVKVSIHRNEQRIVNQSHNTAVGDIIGRDKK